MSEINNVNNNSEKNKTAYEDGIKKIKRRRIVWGSVLAFSTVLFIIFFFLPVNYYLVMTVLNLCTCTWLIALVFFIGSLTLSCKQYEYNGKNIVVYAGWFHHYLMIDGEKFDEHNTVISFVHLMLSTTLDDGSSVVATISLCNSVVLKINEKLYDAKK